MGQWTEYEEHSYHNANTVTRVLYQDVQVTCAVRRKPRRCNGTSQIRLLREHSAPSLCQSYAHKSGRIPRGGTKPKLSLDMNFKATQTRDIINPGPPSSADSTEYVFVSSSPSSTSTLCSEGSYSPHRASRRSDIQTYLKDKALPPLPPSSTPLHHGADMPGRNGSCGALSPLVGIHLINLSSSLTPTSPSRTRAKEFRPKIFASEKPIPRILDAARRAALPKVKRVVYRVGRSIFPKTFMNSAMQEPDILFSNAIGPNLGLRSMSQNNLIFGRHRH